MACQEISGGEPPQTEVLESVVELASGRPAIDVLVRLNAALLQVVVKGLAKGCTPSFDGAELGSAVNCVREALEEDGAIVENDGGLLHPSESFQEADYVERANDEWQVRTLDVLLESVFGGLPGVEVERRDQVGGAALCSSSWTEVFVWTGPRDASEESHRLPDLQDFEASLIATPRAGEGPRGIPCHMPNFIPPELIARMAKLDPVCDFRLDRRERTQAENAGRTFRFWRVEIALGGCLDLRWEQTVPLAASPRTPPHITVEGGRLAETLARAVELAEEVQWDAAGKTQAGHTGTAAP